jgi:hypothetical protein
MSILKSSAPSNSADDLIQSTALDLVASLKNEALSPHDLLDALENRIDEVDHCINALPTLCFERARITADQLMRLPINKRGILCGLPVSIKDLNDVKGVRTTMGSSVFANHTSVESDYMRCSRFTLVWHILACTRLGQCWFITKSSQLLLYCRHEAVFWPGSNGAFSNTF